ncbi:tryptophan synthase beta subunit-like PLP-dependent enzyme [Penicillium angulare]|uniref:tryptophan synthase beta subunit-like PLP-dependent enzyme n=1 Tax=Penicillium angulare TaxID=116970 RepID=UPI0025408954|nr:tryptophan synthase beta subunit-like PLP-dependent enzyme [Penicillium angulare]KAJ5259408.1 tryptophan synthase beta subunit-like PLP-dependent enzyme [Penicillium angulare]
MSNMRPSRNILNAVGNTPCVELHHVDPDGCARIFVKLEGLNPTGSYKDRMARSVIEKAERRGELKPGMTVVEATSGSTGSSLAFVCAITGYKFSVVSSDAFAEEKLKTISTFGATVDIVHSPSGKITPELIPSMHERAKELSNGDGFYYADQFSNPNFLVGYEGLGREMLEQILEGIDAFCGAVGGAGMAMGVARVLKRRRPNVMWLSWSPLRRLFLLKDMGNMTLYDSALAMEESESRTISRRLAKEEGILAGTSTGLNVVTAIELARKLGPGKVVVTVSCDTGLKYVRGNLYIS